MVNNRVFWACQAVLFIERNTKPATDSISDATYLTGVQAVGIDGDIPSNSLADSGRFQQKFRYEDRQKIFNINISRVLNKTSSTFYTTANYSSSYPNTHILHSDNIGSQGEYNPDTKCLKNYDIFILYGDDTAANIGDTANIKYVCYRGCLLNSLSYDINVASIITESITLTCKKLEYGTVSVASLPTVPANGSTESGNILKRTDIGFTLPQEAEAIFNTDASLTVNDSTVYGIQSINLSLDLEYTNLNDVGIWRGYDSITDINLWDFLVVPVSVTATFNGIARSIYPNQSLGNSDREFNPNKTIKVTGNTGSDYFIWDLGTKNYLTSISKSGGDTGGGNVEISLTYTNEYSDFIVAKNSTIYSINNTGPY